MKRRLSLSSKERKDGPVSPVAAGSSDKEVGGVTLDDADQGHRHGNFHNYYSFNPPSNRLDKMKGILAYLQESAMSVGTKRQRPNEDGPTNHVKAVTNDGQEKDNGDAPDSSEGTQTQRFRSIPFTYCDLGCNEGDFTIEMAKALHERLGRSVRFEGIDIDPVLIGRAATKWSDNTEETIKGSFRAANVCDAIEDLDSFDMISLLSTTMWIHVHVGDEGLEKLLRGICMRANRYIIIEPQPSKCYRKAVVRLRRMHRPELDTSVDRLSWRKNLEPMIEETLNKAGFHRVSALSDGNERTNWNRSIQLYEKKTEEA